MPRTHMHPEAPQGKHTCVRMFVCISSDCRLMAAWCELPHAHDRVLSVGGVGRFAGHECALRAGAHELIGARRHVPCQALVCCSGLTFGRVVELWTRHGLE